MTQLPRLCIGFAALVLASAPAPGADLYKWIDENGVTNYSNNPPPKSRGGKPVTIVEDRLSVYTPEKAVTDALAKRAQKPAPALLGASAAREPEGRPKTAPPLPPLVYDPCLTSTDVNCYTLYDGSPVFAGRRRPPRLTQPELPLGATAGNITGPNSFTAGQSGTAPQAAAPRRPREPGGKLLTKEPEPDGAGRRLR